MLTSTWPVGKVRVDRIGAARDHRTCESYHALRTQRFKLVKARAADLNDTLGQAVVVAQIDEQQVAVIALAMDPARDPGDFADVAFAQRATCMGTISVHGV